MKGHFTIIALILLYLIVLSVSSSFGQKSENNLNMLEKIAIKKNHFYQKLIASEKMKTVNQEKYDVKYYSLDLSPDPSSQILSGSVKILAEVLSPSLDSLELNFWDGMNISDIHFTVSPGTQLTYVHNNDLLLIALDSTFLQGEQITIEIVYSGSPQNSGYDSFGFDTYNGQPMIWTLSEPFGARAWWPCKDIPSDKADSVDIKVSVPNNLIVASNGTLRETTTIGNTTTYWWHEQYPITTYLVSLAIHPYTVYYDDYLYNNNTDTMKIHFYMFPDHYNQFYAFNAKTKQMIQCFANLFGEYPFVEEKYGHADYQAQHYVAMEHQTCSTIDFTWYNNDPFLTEWVINHELAHQWWGNLITCNSFHHAWLNEGFATYSSAFWYEYLSGPGAASNYMMTVALYLGGGTVYVFDPANDDIFNVDLRYKKGAWVLHMLRHTVTDSIFFNILRTYASSPEHRFGTATTEEFKSICEQVSGMNLEKFFQQWIYEEYHPAYAYNWATTLISNMYRIDLAIEQRQQNTILFWMPIDVKITTNSYDTLFVAWDSLQSQTFSFLIDEEPVNVELDPDDWILKIAVIDTNISVGIRHQDENIIREIALHQNYPNPFNPSTTIEFDLPKSSKVTLKVFNIIGEKVVTLVSDRLSTGSYSYEWDASNLASGVYLYRLQADDYVDTRKMVLMR